MKELYRILETSVFPNECFILEGTSFEDRPFYIYLSEAHFIGAPFDFIFQSHALLLLLLHPIPLIMTPSVVVRPSTTYVSAPSRRLRLGLWLLVAIAASRGAHAAEDETNPTRQDDESFLVKLHRSFLSPAEMSHFERELLAVQGGDEEEEDPHRRHLRFGTRGGDRGGGGGGGGDRDITGGGLTDSEQEDILSLLAHRGDIDRGDPKSIDRGLEVTTRSKTNDVDVVAVLHRHVYDMTHLGDRLVRQGDPLFQAIFDHHGDMHLEVDYLDNGVSVKHTAKTDCGEILVQDHTDTVTRFVDTGRMSIDWDWKLPKACGV